ncbi:MAG: hypothetical protein WKF46_09855 [Candidatus Limnocylindrales bacterium]
MSGDPQDIRNPFFSRLYHHVLQGKTKHKDAECRRDACLRQLPPGA